jgi:hypothetical protein
MTFRQPIRLFPTGLGYTLTETASNVGLGLKHWGQRYGDHITVGHTSFHPYSKLGYTPLNDPAALTFGDNVAELLHFNGSHEHSQDLKIKGDIIVMGPYNGLSRHITGHHTQYISFSNIRFTHFGTRVKCRY